MAYATRYSTRKIAAAVGAACLALAGVTMPIAYAQETDVSDATTAPDSATSESSTTHDSQTTQGSPAASSQQSTPAVQPEVVAYYVPGGDSMPDPKTGHATATGVAYGSFPEDTEGAPPEGVVNEILVRQHVKPNKDYMYRPLPGAQIRVYKGVYEQEIPELATTADERGVWQVQIPAKVNTGGPFNYDTYYFDIS
ncbi:hypothetical protein [Trueperella bialowiezensis]|uniref:Uncharacterized protein n=1 Tax=Trueperella bialowiezensis TaxID=312285 RepID=A0A3S4X6A8_9ACTO|nr:hypothetical protein [Trueperella bialowiezensis]VEI13590.1 Uncharacterised protein [Trueperella bialowiezensis]